MDNIEKEIVENLKKLEETDLNIILDKIIELKQQESWLALFFI